MKSRYALWPGEKIVLIILIVNFSPNLMVIIHSIRSIILYRYHVALLHELRRSYDNITFHFTFFSTI